MYANLRSTHGNEGGDDDDCVDDGRGGNHSGRLTRLKRRGK
jgi:hypothetical protein